MELLTSKKFKLPVLWFITDRKEIEEIPPGFPFIYGNEEIKDYLIRLLEYEILYFKAKQTGLPIKFDKILKENGYDDLEAFNYHFPAFFDGNNGSTERVVYNPDDVEDCEDIDVRAIKDDSLFKQYVRDCAAYVDLEKLKQLNVFPIWLTKMEDAVNVNLMNFALFNPNMYNKKLDGMYGGFEFSSPNRNLICVDISSSIPKAVSTTCLIMAKNLAESFYCDIMITGSKTTLYPYEELYKLTVETAYADNGTSNEQVFFKRLVTRDVKHYQTAIFFGDNNTPCYAWTNDYDRERAVELSIAQGQQLCKWTVEKLISFHTDGTEDIAAYASWFKPKETERIADWVQYLEKV